MVCFEDLEMARFEDLEIWDYVPWDKNYKVSSKGNVFSLKTNKYLKPQENIKSGRYHVSFWSNGRQKTEKIHKLVAFTFYFIDDYKDYEIDHKDRNYKNNNLLNVRFCSRSENCYNQGIRTNNTSGYKGVCWFKRDKKWVARIYVNKTKHVLGYFKDKEEAYKAYCKASKELHKEFSNCP